jgi:hypothetical protein
LLPKEYGSIIGLKSLRPIKKGKESFVNYELRKVTSWLYQELQEDFEIGDEV